MDYTSEDLGELYNRRRELAKQIANYFHGGEVYEGDEGYQALLRDLEETVEQINEFN
jgi:flagellar biosynthesis chaperone FliJ